MRAEGLEPSRAVKLNGFSYRLRLSPPQRYPEEGASGLRSGLSLHRARDASLRCCPSSLYTFPVGIRGEPSSRAPSGFGSGSPLQVSPNLSSSTSRVSPRALKLFKSVVSAVPPRPRGYCPTYLSDRAFKCNVTPIAIPRTLKQSITFTEWVLYA